VNANAYPDASEARSDSVATESSLPVLNNPSHSLQDPLPIKPAPQATKPSLRQNSGPDMDASMNGVRGYSPPRAPHAGTSRTAQLFALAEQYDLQGLEAAFEGMQSSHRLPTAHQGAAGAQAMDEDSQVGDKQGARHLYVHKQKSSPQTPAQPFNSLPAHADSLATPSSAPLNRQLSQVCTSTVSSALLLLHTRLHFALN
jgi:hypothetical protein